MGASISLEDDRIQATVVLDPARFGSNLYVYVGVEGKCALADACRHDSMHTPHWQSRPPGTFNRL